MIFRFEHNGKRYWSDTDKGIDISMLLDPDAKGPNCFYADRPSFDAVRAGDFIGSVKEGGSVNYYDVRFNPHGNGTHTECQGHITETWEKISDLKIPTFLPAELITIEPTTEGQDQVITKEQVERAISHKTKALIVRTLPNGAADKYKDHSGSNPPYVESSAIDLMVDKGIEHLLIDLPSVDREEDGGLLAAHRSFWKLPAPGGREHCTITEMIYVDPLIPDGLYLLNIQTPSMALDACPSRPVLFNMNNAQ